MKTKIHHTIHLSKSILSGLLTIAVLMTSLHAKDLAAAQAPQVLGSNDSDQALLFRQIERPIDKSLGDLHHHVDNTMVKNMTKSFSGDTAIMNNGRRERGEVNEEQSISVRVIEMMLMIKLAYAYATS